MTLRFRTCALVIGLVVNLWRASAADTWLSPIALAATTDGKTLFIACATANRVLCLDTETGTVTGLISTPESPTGLALSADDKWLCVTCAAPESRVCMVDVPRKAIAKTITSGHTTLSPVFDPSGRTLYVCNRFNNVVGVLDLAAGAEVGRIQVRREPVAAALSRDGRTLLVAHHLPDGPADREYVAASLSVVNVAADQVEREVQLPNGSGVVNDLELSPDGKYAVLTHLVASFQRAAAQVSQGWMNANALTIVDMEGIRVLATVLLDTPSRGAANPWGLAWSADASKLLVTHAGTHEVSVIDFPELVAEFANSKSARGVTRRSNPILAFVSRYEGMDAGLPFLVGARKRVKLPGVDLGPRAVVVVGQKAYVANYFSDSLSVIDLATEDCRAESISLGPKREMDEVRKGEFYFHDARLCLQGWQSCASCHPGDGRVDGLNWDLLNDGVGNAKSTKSLLLAHQTPPAMSLGVRGSAEVAVRSGIKNILFTKQAEEVPSAIDTYLKSLRPAPSPYLKNGELSEAASRGKEVFARSGCAACHPGPVFTDRQAYDVGTGRAFDRKTDQFDTPTLIEVWRTAPYLHDGSAATIRDVLTTRNKDDQHGQTSKLSGQELDDLCAYVLSL